MLFSDNATTLLCKRYFHRGEKHSVCYLCQEKHETETEFVDRVGFYNEEYVSIIKAKLFFPNSPTAFSAPCRICGETEVKGTLSACFKFDVQDSMESIMDVAKKAAMVQKWGGGVGYYVGGIRAKGSPIASTHQKACGPVAVLRHYHSVGKLITQAGRRDSAQMGILDCDHPDIREFIHMKDDDPEGLSTFNLSVACTDDFMEKVKTGDQGKRYWLFQEMCQSAWKTGDPGVYFVDRAEKDNPTPWLGRLNGTNPCGESPLLNNEACTLGSINLSLCCNPAGGHIHWQLLREVTAKAVRYLNHALDTNKYPDPAIADAVARTRKMGIGVMGWADMLAKLHIHYDSDEAVELGRSVMGTIQLAARKESAELSYHHGAVQGNATLTCIAPTGSISILAGCSSGIEPHFALENTRTLGDGSEMVEKVQDFNGFTPRIAHEIGWEWHVKHQAAFQEHTDLAVSKTINLPNTATLEDIGNAWMMMWKMGCKGGTVYRDGSRDKQVLKAVTIESEELRQANELTKQWGKHIAKVAMAAQDKALDEVKESEDEDTQVADRKRLPTERQAVTHKFRVGEQEGYITVGLFEDGSPGEVFIIASQQGSTVQGLLNGVAVVTSMALQHGVPLERLVAKFRGAQFEPAGMTENKEIPTATSVLDYVFRWLGKRFGDPIGEAYANGNACPWCGAVVRYAEGCESCSKECGWTKC